MKIMGKKYAIHLFTIENKFLLYDMYSGNIYQIEEEIYNKLQKIMNSVCNEEAINDEKIRYLLNCGILGERAAEEHIDENINIAYLSFAPEYQCNLRCTYCFGECGEKYLGEKRFFSVDDMKKAIDYFMDELFPNCSKYRIDFVSGGEPLLRFSIVQEAVLYAEKKAVEEKKKISIWLCTNAILLDDKICEFLSNHNVSIGISLDGRKEKHDENRKDVQGKGTYDCVIQKIKDIQNNNFLSHKFKNIWGLCTATADNCDFVDIIKHFSELKINNLQIRLVRNEKELDYEYIKQKYKELALFLIKTFLEGNENYLDMIVNDNDQFGKVLKRIFLGDTVTRRCNAGINKITVCPNGDIYPCDSLVGWENCKIGDIGEEKLNLSVLEHTDVFTREKCCDCTINILCGGDCYHNAYKKNGNIYTVANDFCQIQREIIEQAIYVKFELMSKDGKRYEKYINKLMMKEEYRKIYG